MIQILVLICMAGIVGLTGLCSILALCAVRENSLNNKHGALYRVVRYGDYYRIQRLYRSTGKHLYYCDKSHIKAIQNNLNNKWLDCKVKFINTNDLETYDDAMVVLEHLRNEYAKQYHDAENEPIPVNSKFEAQMLDEAAATRKQVQEELEDIDDE